MKKVVFLLVFAVLFVSPSAFAALTISDSSDFTLGSTETDTVGLSSNVTAAYENGGVTTPQWYAIATAHLGGKKIYGTAQDVTNIYRLVDEKTPGVEITTSTFSGMPADSTASSEWSSGVWEKM